MKILIIDDNVAIQEILAEILTVDGYEISMASSVNEGKKLYQSFRPDAIILDSQVNGESGLRILDSIEETSEVRVIILTTGKEQIPKDSPFIYGDIQKPFKSGDILQKVRSISANLEEKHGKEKKIKFKLFSKPVTEKMEPEDTMNIRFGKSYVVFEQEPNNVYKLGSGFVAKGCSIMVVTAGRIKTATERFKGNEVKVLGLSPRPRNGYIEISKMGTLMGEISAFIGEKEKPVVLIDGLEQIIAVNGLNTVLTMLFQIINGGVNKPATLIVSMNPESLTDKDRELILHDMELYEE